MYLPQHCSRQKGFIKIMIPQIKHRTVFFKCYYEGHHYDILSLTHMCSGPSMFMVLTREDAVAGWRAMMGPPDPEAAKDQNPNTIRALFGQSILDNAVHGSSDPEHASVEIKHLFGEVEFNPDGSVKGSEGEQGQQEEGEEDDGEAGSGAEQETATAPG